MLLLEVVTTFIAINVAVVMLMTLFMHCPRHLDLLAGKSVDYDRVIR